MTTAEAAFEHRLKVFSRQVEEAAQFLYVAATINGRARLNADTFRALNRTAGFWVTVTGGLQMSAIVAVGRIFDSKPQDHTVDTLLRFAEQHLHVFAPTALVERKRRTGVREQHLPAVLERAHAPNAKDFHRLGRLLRRHRHTYKSQFRNIRHLDLAHTVVIDPGKRAELYARTRRNDLERLIVFLTQLHDALWHLFQNGRRPTLPRMSWSSRALVRRKVGDPRKFTAHEAVVIDTKECLQLVTDAWRARNPRRDDSVRRAAMEPVGRSV